MHLPEFTAVGMLGFAMRSGASRATPKDAEHSQVRSRSLGAASKRSTQRDRLGVGTRVQSPGYTPRARVQSLNTYQPQQQALVTTRIQQIASNRPSGIAPSTPDSEKFDRPNGNRAKGPGLSGWGYPTREPVFRIKPARAPRDNLPAATAAGLVMKAAPDIDQVT